MALKMVGGGKQYAAAFTDSEGKPLDGSETYKLQCVWLAHCEVEAVRRLESAAHD